MKVTGAVLEGRWRRCPNARCGSSPSSVAGGASPGAKEQEIRDALGMTATSYYQLLNDLIDRPEALVFDPALVTRLRRQRARRHRMRSAGPDRRDGTSW